MNRPSDSDLQHGQLEESAVKGCSFQSLNVVGSKLLFSDDQRQMFIVYTRSVIPVISTLISAGPVKTMTAQPGFD